MDLKHHTIIFVPHSRAKFRKWRVSTRAVKLFVAALAVLTLGVSFVTWSHFSTSVNLDELAELRGQNEQLREINQTFETSIRELQAQLADYEDQTSSLAIVAGLDDMILAEPTSPGAASGVGGDLSRGQEAPIDLIALGQRSRQLSEALEGVRGHLEERDLRISSMPAITPVRGIFTSRYGYRSDPITGRRAFHPGIDISAPPGKPVIATADGVVTHSGRNGGLGRAVFLAHGFGMVTRYGHLSETNVKPGQQVRRGDVVGFVGNTGRSTGYHLHYEVLDTGEARNPVEFMLDR